MLQMINVKTIIFVCIAFVLGMLIPFSNNNLPFLIRTPIKYLHYELEPTSPDLLFTLMYAIKSNEEGYTRALESIYDDESKLREFVERRKEVAILVESHFENWHPELKDALSKGGKLYYYKYRGEWGVLVLRHGRIVYKSPYCGRPPERL